jgi:hypothetical protein
MEASQKKTLLPTAAFWGLEDVVEPGLEYIQGAAIGSLCNPSPQGAIPGEEDVRSRNSR